ncbi:MAG: DUF1735 domain-containing protein [Ferruginibacter sp.]
MSITKYFIGCLAIATVALSCKKSTKFDITGDPDIKFFTNTQSFGTGPQNALTYSAVNIPNGAGSGLLNLSSTIPATIKFPVFASKQISQDVTVTAKLDTTLIATYNAANNTSYAAFPVGVLNADGLLAHIAKGTASSSDSITITTNAPGFNLLTGTAYMAPIKLTTVSPGEGSITAASTQVTYIIVNVEQRRIKYLATTADVIGALLTPRTAWTSAFTPAPTTTGSIFDGSTTTFSRWTASPVQLDVNMQAIQNVTGIRLYTANTATYVPTQIDVYLSNDGITYDKIGSDLKANITYASSYNYILFYKAIQAKYIRLNLSYTTNTNAQNYRIVEFDVYGN